MRRDRKLKLTSNEGGQGVEEEGKAQRGDACESDGTTIVCRDFFAHSHEQLVDRNASREICCQVINIILCC